MKSTEGGSTKKTKTAIKAKDTAKKTVRKKLITRKKVIDTKHAIGVVGLNEDSTRKKSEGPAKKAVRKKKTTRKKVGDTKKAMAVLRPSAEYKKATVAKGKPKKKKLASKSTNEESLTKSVSKRRSDRNRNNSLNSEETSDLKASAEETSWKGINRKEKNKNKSTKRKKDASKDGHVSSGDNWQAYDLGSLESDETWNEHFHRLQEFHSHHGHSAVLTDLLWETEPDFAKWVSQQKQLFREIRTGYRMASLKEERRWRRLQVLQFPLDCEHWLWHQMYNELCELLNGEKINDTMILPSRLTEWVERQKEFAKIGVHGSRIDSERRANLESLGVLRRDDANVSDSDEE